MGDRVMPKKFVYLNHSRYGDFLTVVIDNPGDSIAMIDMTVEEFIVRCYRRFK